MRCKNKPFERSRSHRQARGGDLLLCFTSRRSGSSTAAAAAASSSGTAMRAPSTKSLPSPGRSRDAAAAAAPSLSSSLSRRLRNSGSVKGGQSPMFPAVVGGRRKGVAFEAAEPTSPKVTCIGQVRIKSKKKKAAAAKSKARVMRSRSGRGSGREASFRRMEYFESGRECLPSRNNKWVHQLPVSICEALRAFGSEFNCFSPCGSWRSSCFSSSSPRSVEGKGGVCREKRSGSCGAAFARWLMAVPDGEEGKTPGAAGVVADDRRDRELGMVIGQRIKKEDLDLGMEMEKVEEVVMVVEKGEEKEEDEAKVSICIPPRNALLLMRCRSDPVKMAALTSRFWDSPAMKVRVEEEREEEEENDGRGVNIDRCAESNIDVDVVEAEESSSKETAAETKQSLGQEEAAEASVDASILTEESMAESDGLERKEEEVLLIPGEEMQNDEENIKEVASAPVNDNSNAGDEQQMGKTAAAEAVNTQSGEKQEEKEMRDEVVDLPDGEDDKEVDKGRRSSSCASTVGKQERAQKYISRSKEGGRRRSLSSRERDRRHSFSTERDVRKPSFGSEKEIRRASFSMEGKGRWRFSIEKDCLKLEKGTADEQKSKEPNSPDVEDELSNTIQVQNSQSTEKGEGREEDDYSTEHCPAESEAAQKRAEEKKNTELPDCLLLMMYEPKLSMEVSEETWVCSTDFLQWHLHNPNLPRHPPKSTAPVATVAATTDNGINGTSLDEVAGDEASEITNDMGNENREFVAPMQETSQPSPPPPPAPPTASDSEQEIKSNVAVLTTPVSASTYAPFVLTRCKSEPMRSSVQLTPDAFFWKDRHRPIEATKIGF